MGKKLLIEYGTLRFSIIGSLLTEVDIGVFAKRIKDKGFVHIEDAGAEIIVLVNPLEPVSVDDIIIPKPDGLVFVFDYPGKNNIKVLHKLYADSPVDSISLMTGALDFFKTLVPDSQVSPAARKVIKTYWNRYKDDDNKVTQNFIDKNEKIVIRHVSGGEDKDRWDQDYLNAAYHGTNEFPVKQFLSRGENIVNMFSNKFDESTDDIYSAIVDGALKGFNKVYKDKSRTKMADDNDKESTDSEQINDKKPEKPKSKFLGK